MYITFLVRAKKTICTYKISFDSYVSFFQSVVLHVISPQIGFIRGGRGKDEELMVFLMVRDKKLKAKSKLLGFSDRSFINTSEEENKLASNNQQDITAHRVRAYYLGHSFFNNRIESNLLLSSVRLLLKLFLVHPCCQVCTNICPIWVD